MRGRYSQHAELVTKKQQVVIKRERERERKFSRMGASFKQRHQQAVRMVFFVGCVASYSRVTTTIIITVNNV